MFSSHFALNENLSLRHREDDISIVTAGLRVKLAPNVGDACWFVEVFCFGLGWEVINAAEINEE